MCHLFFLFTLTLELISWACHSASAIGHEEPGPLVGRGDGSFENAVAPAEAEMTSADG